MPVNCVKMIIIFDWFFRCINIYGLCCTVYVAHFVLDSMFLSIISRIFIYFFLLHTQFISCVLREICVIEKFHSCFSLLNTFHSWWIIMQHFYYIRFRLSLWNIYCSLLNNCFIFFVLFLIQLVWRHMLLRFVLINALIQQAVEIYIYIIYM